jgi:hypothetical protein
VTLHHVTGYDCIITKAFGESRSEIVHVLLDRYARVKIHEFSRNLPWVGMDEG